MNTKINLLTCHFSGSHLLSYYLSILFERDIVINSETLIEHKIKNKNPIFFTHSTVTLNQYDKFLNQNDKFLIVLVRKDYKNYLMRILSYYQKNNFKLPHYDKNSINEETLNNLSIFMKNYNINNDNGQIKLIKEYFNKLSYYDNYNGNKIIIYYEDLINNPIDVMKKIIKFIDEPISTNEFEKNINEHNLNISNIYTNKHYGHRRNSNLNDLYYKSIPNKYIDEINIFFKKLNPYLYDKYLN